MTTQTNAGGNSPAATSANIDTADHVRHKPTGENWVVACVQGNRLSWCGWPEGSAELTDCELTYKATQEERNKLLHDLASMGGGRSDHRQRYAHNRLSEAQAATAALEQADTQAAPAEALPDTNAAAAFWASVFPEGMTAEQVQAELTDYHFLLEQVPKVYDHVTGGLLSKTNYHASTVIAFSDDHFTKLAEQEAPTEGEWVKAEDVKRLTRDIDVALNGIEGAAEQASLSDVASQMEAEVSRRGRPLLAEGAAPAAAAPTLATDFDITLTEEESDSLRQTIGDDEDAAPIRLTRGDGHSGYGLYVSHADYPEEGASLLKAIPQPAAPEEPTADYAAGFADGREQALAAAAHAALLAAQAAPAVPPGPRRSRPPSP